MSENYRIRKIHGRLQRAGGSGVKDNPRKLLPLSLNIYRFRLMKSPFLQNLDELPGPVWLFGAYGMTRLGEWSFALLMQCVNGNLRLDDNLAGLGREGARQGARTRGGERANRHARFGTQRSRGIGQARRGQRVRVSARCRR